MSRRREDTEISVPPRLAVRPESVMVRRFMALELDRLERVHLLGIGGIGVSAVARLLLARGIRVSGSDVKESSITRELRREGAILHIGHDASHLSKDLQAVIHSTAIPADNVELVAARTLGLPIHHRSDLLAALVADHADAVGVTGTHGKGTVCTMVTRILDHAGRNPGWCIGAMPMDYGVNARSTDGSVFVAEVDESDGSQLRVRPVHVLVTFIEADHLNYYDSVDDIVAHATRFVTENDRLQTLVLNVGCAGVRDLAGRLDQPWVGYCATGQDVGADWTLSEIDAGPRSVGLDVLRKGDRLGRLELPVPGEHNAENALAATALAMEAFGVSFGQCAEALAKFHGLENRFTIVDVPSLGVTLVKDYLSHPTGMRKVLRAARRLVDADRGGRLVVVYKPYRFTLLKYLGGEYAEAFEAADHVVLTNLYSGGETPIEGIDDDYLPNSCRERGLEVTHVDDTEDIAGFLDEWLRPGDAVALFGGDDFFRMADGWAESRQGPG